MAKGRIFNIAHYAVHDGPGIRTSAFLKGCPARCLWCCSPQSQSFEIERSFVSGKLFGRDLDARELFDEVRRDAPFWRRSGGGVTLSGGEALAQPDFAAEFFSICRANNVHTALETCLFAEADAMDRVVSLCDYVQFDIKTMDPERHKRLTGLDNRWILANAARLLASDKTLLVRYPLVPGINDGRKELEALGRFLETARSGVSLELLRYHKLGVGLYEELGRPYALGGVEPPTDEEFSRAIAILKEFNIHVF